MDTDLAPSTLTRFYPYWSAGTTHPTRQTPGSGSIGTALVTCRDPPDLVCHSEDEEAWGIVTGLAQTIAQLIADEHPIDATALADPDVELSSLVSTQAG